MSPPREQDPAPDAAPRALAVRRLTLTDFRNHGASTISVPADTDTGAAAVVLTGANGAGKTNVLEAVSLLTPGRGLRRARLADLARKDGPGGWSVAAEADGANGPVTLASGVVASGPAPPARQAANEDGPAPDAAEDEAVLVETRERRVVRIDGANAPGPAALAEHLSAVWLTPQMDRLFLEGAAGRRRFLDRLAFGLDPGHAAQATAYDKALRDRSRLLRQRIADTAWLAALEARMVEAGLALAAARTETVAALEDALGAPELTDGPFPRARVALDGALEDRVGTADAAPWFADRLKRGRARDGETGGASVGPHRTDLLVRHADKDMPAAQCSTGEQKALLIGLVLANARLQTDRRRRVPILLLDEVAAHLDGRRRAALYDAIRALGGQAWLTGTDRSLFEDLEGRARFLTVDGGRIEVEDDG